VSIALLVKMSYFFHIGKKKATPQDILP